MVCIRFFVCMFVFANCTISAFIYRVTVLRFEKGPITQTVVGYHDIHDRDAEKNQKQRDYFQQFFTACDKKKVKLFVEDLSSANHRNVFACGSHQFDSRGGLLGGIVDLARNAGLGAACIENLEYRYCRAAAFGYAFNQLRTGKRVQLMIPPISIKQLMQEIDVELYDLQHMHDLPHFLITRSQTLSQGIEKRMTDYQWDVHHQEFIGDYIANRSQRIRIDDIEDFLTFDSGILDIKLARAVAKNQDKTAIIIAGGSHIENSFKMLKHMGYKTVYATRLQSLPHEKLQSILRQCEVII